MTQIRSSLNVWTLFAAVTLTVIIAAALVWAIHHPYGVHWDEAQYLNEGSIDAQRLQHGMLLKLGGRLLVKSWGRPPAYRLLALPLLGLLGFHTTTARCTSLICYALSSLFVYLASRRIAGRGAGGFAMLCFLLSPVVVSASIWFSTEGPLYLATSAMFYFLFRIWDDRTEQSIGWIGLGLAIGLGLLSKASFIAIMAPVMLLWLVAGRWERIGIGHLISLWKAGLVALIVAGPWWALNIKPAIAMAQQARGFVANSLGPPSFGTWARWLSTVCQSLLGYGLSILICVVLLGWIYRRFIKKSVDLVPSQKAALWASACAGCPIVLIQLTGTNHLLRHISPAVIPLAIAAGVLVGNLDWDRSRAFVVLTTVLLVAQLLLIVTPLFFPNREPLDAGLANASLPWRIMARSEQWDWDPLLRISRDCGIDSPAISYLGLGPAFNQPQIERPWATWAASMRDTTFPYPDVRLLWRYEQGPLDWAKVMAAAEQSDIVVTAPHYVGDVTDKDDVENRHNAEFAARLSSDSAFRSPISLEMGRFKAVELQVFTKKSLPCHLPESVPGKP